jgi:hypothetical protein
MDASSSFITFLMSFFCCPRAGGEGHRPGLRRRFHRPHGLGLTCCSCRRTPCHWVSIHLYLQYTPRLVVVFFAPGALFPARQQLPTFSKTAALVGAENGSLVLHLVRWGKRGNPCRSRSLSPKWKRLFCLLFESLVVSVLAMGPASFPLNYRYPALLIWSTSSKA